MNRWLVVFAAIAALSAANAEVVELSDASFDAELESFDTALVMFYAPWCGHCKRMKPEFDEASKALAANDPPVTLAKVDCTEAGKESCGRFDVRGYPTLKIFRGGEVSSDYNGPREAAGIVKYMRSQVGPSSKELKSEADVKAFLEKAGDVVVVGYLADKSDLDTFNKLADSMRETVVFGHTDGSFGSRKGVVLHRPKHLQTKLEDAEVVYEGKVDRDAVKKWIKANYHGLVGHRTVDNSRDFASPLVIAYFDVDYVKNVKGTNYWRNRIMKVAKKFDGLTFAVANKDDFMQELQEFGISPVGQEKPMIAVRDEQKYVMETEFSVEAFEAFLNDFKAGKVEPYIKSEPVPEDNDSNPVKVAVARNFDELVTKSGKDALVEFYAPWCGHCKKLTPIYDELGEKMADEDVNIVKMDATANDVPSGYDVRGFPTIFWVPASGKPEAYQGGREVDDFVKFIAENSSNGLKGFDKSGKPKKSEL